MCQTPQGYSVVLNDRIVFQAATHISTDSLRQQASGAPANAGLSPQLHFGQILLRCRILPSTAFRAYPSQMQAYVLGYIQSRADAFLGAGFSPRRNWGTSFSDAGFSPQLHSGHILHRCKLLSSAAFSPGQILLRCRLQPSAALRAHPSQMQASALSCIQGKFLLRCLVTCISSWTQLRSSPG